MAYTDRQLRNITIFARVAGGLALLISVVALISVLHTHLRTPWGCLCRC